MKLCANCGNSLPAGASFCPVCGAPASPDRPASPAGEAASSRPEAGAPSAGEEPVPPPAGEGTPPSGTGAGHISFTEPSGGTADPAAPPGFSGEPRYGAVAPQQPDGGLTTAQYFWTLVLFSVPVAGLIPMVYWSFGSTASPARRRLARASLIRAGVLTVVGVLAAAVLAFHALRLGRSLLYGWYGDPYGSYDDSYGDYYDGYDDFYDSYGGWPFDLFGGQDGFGSGGGDGRIY